MSELVRLVIDVSLELGIETNIGSTRDICRNQEIASWDSTPRHGVILTLSVEPGLRDGKGESTCDVCTGPVDTVRQRLLPVRHGEGNVKNLAETGGYESAVDQVIQGGDQMRQSQVHHEVSSPNNLLTLHNSPRQQPPNPPQQHRSQTILLSLSLSLLTSFSLELRGCHPASHCPKTLIGTSDSFSPPFPPFFSLNFWVWMIGDLGRSNHAVGYPTFHYRYSDFVAGWNTLGLRGGVEPLK